MNENKLIVFDIDGTLADLTHRVHLVQTKPTNWPAFFAGVKYDDPIEEVVWINNILHSAGSTIILCSGRPESTRIDTELWLDKHKIEFDELYMRADNDHRDDTLVKSDLADEIEETWWDISMVFDDRQKVVDMWRARGIKTYQCAKGNF